MGTAIEGYVGNLFTLLETDPARGREILSRFVAPIVMTPENRRLRSPLLGNRGLQSLIFPGRCCAARTGSQCNARRQACRQ
jgi:hypothetical protein